MNKVIVSIFDKNQIVTSFENAKKNKFLITYAIEVKKENKLQPPPNWELNVPIVGSILKGIGGHVYVITKIQPIHRCSVCQKSGKDRINTRFYCTPHYNNLVITKPIRNTNQIPGRNSICHCGSSLKYKHCCLKKDAHKPRHYYNSLYKQ